MFNFLKDTSTKKEIEALLLVTYADGKIKVSENESLEKILESVNWQESFRYNGRFGEIITTVRAALENEAQLEGLVKGIANLDDTRKTFIIKCCEKLAAADGKFDGTEKALIERFRK